MPESPEPCSAVFFNSSSITRWKASNGWAPGMNRPLMKNTGVAETPRRSPEVRLPATTAAARGSWVHAVKRVTSRPSAVAYCVRSLSSRRALFAKSRSWYSQKRPWSCAHRAAAAAALARG